MRADEQTISYEDAPLVFPREIIFGRDRLLEKVQTGIVDTLTRWWTGADARQSGVVLKRLLPIALVAICAATFAVGVPRLRLYSHDIFICLDGGWRILHGQRPILDFYAVKGPAWFMLFGAVLAVAKDAATALAYASTIVAVLISVWSYFILRPRMEPAPCFIACIWLVLLSVSPFPLGEYPSLSSFAMTFNRYGYALLSLVLLECFLPSRDDDPFRKQFSGGFSSGVACAVMLFVKISYGLVGLVLSAASVVLRRRERARQQGLIAGFIAFVLPVLAYLRFDFSAILREYRILAGARGKTVTLTSILSRLYEDRFELAPILLLTVLVIVFAVRSPARRIAIGAACLMAASAGTLLIMTNTQENGLPLISTLALLLVNEVTSTTMRPKAEANEPVPQLAVVLVSFGLLAAGLPMLINAAGFAHALADKVMPRHPGYHLPTPELAAVDFVEFDIGRDWARYENGELFVKYTEEGIELVRSHSLPNESVRSMTNVNPFSYALLRPPSHGGAVDINPADVSERSMPPLDLLVGDVDLILIPKYPELPPDPTIQLVLSRYHDDLRRMYRVEAESPHWTLLRKRTLPSLTSAGKTEEPGAPTQPVAARAAR